MHRNLLVVMACACLILGGCSSRPREFKPTLAAPQSNLAAFDQAYAICNQLLVEGKLDQKGRSASLGVGAAAGATTAAVGLGTGAAIGGYGGLAAASATIVLLPFAIVGGAWGMAKMKRAKREKAIMTAVTGCLHERGFDVAGWKKAPQNERGTTAVITAE
ncbi:hypothetical protein SH584_02710 [Sphingomonas sp. LY29]|uniref:hypothetical protein n=1 Tax=unclassified Sphingomonas TaxID=196159 RepID=UPI002ADEE668|nr:MULTISPECIES: hypothetical protein [unclassified Sphingomonas]MEA1070907.1 hypothetical protein [Sphingomonas sp. LY160]WRP26368.1 hypothetical protein SH584_02710 [Sphingomonas sp. LY29]